MDEAETRRPDSVCRVDGPEPTPPLTIRRSAAGQVREGRSPGHLDLLAFLATPLDTEHPTREYAHVTEAPVWTHLTSMNLAGMREQVTAFRPVANEEGLSLKDPQLALDSRTTRGCDLTHGS
jgi:hypothetical protein